MVGRLANFSGREVVKILQKRFGFFFISQKGSHVKLRKSRASGIITVIVPLHPELSAGTLSNILRQAQVSINDFLYS